jgi:hypothetical protein
MLMVVSILRRLRKTIDVLVCIFCGGIFSHSFGLFIGRRKMFIFSYSLPFRLNISSILLKITHSTRGLQTNKTHFQIFLSMHLLRDRREVLTQ